MGRPVQMRNIIRDRESVVFGLEASAITSVTYGYW